MNSVKTISACVIIAVICLTSPFSITAKESDWPGARQEFQDNSRNNNDKKRVACTARLSENITPKTDVEAAKLLLDQLTAEMARNNDGKNEERVNIDVINACVSGLRKITTDKAIESIIKKSADPKTNWRIRFYVIRAMGSINNPAVTQALSDLLNEKESALQMSALDALTELAWPEGIQAACNLLATNTAWEVKLAAVGYLRKIKSLDSITPMKQAIIRNKDMEALILSELLDLIKELSKDIPPETQDQEDPSLTKSVIDLGQYYKIKINSDRIVFILDISGSMGWEHREPTVKEVETKKEEAKPKPVTTGEPEKEPAAPTEPQVQTVPEPLQKKKKEIDSRIPKTRIDAVKKESVNAIYYLDPRVNFSIIFYNGDIEVWKNDLVPATYENKMDAITAIDGRGPGGGTNIYDAIEAAYKMVKSAGNAPAKPKDEPKAEPKKVVSGDKKGQPNIDKIVSGADTVFLLTDGQPTVGKILLPDDIINSVRRLNDLRRIKINTIAVGASDSADENTTDQLLVNIYLMRRIAEVTGGSFVDKTYQIKKR
ncbi:MAG: hypothetical protein V1701_00105 [Planctomycetota bacterium]